MNPQAPKLLVLLLVPLCQSVVAQNENLFSAVNEAIMRSMKWETLDLVIDSSPRNRDHLQTA